MVISRRLLIVVSQVYGECSPRQSATCFANAVLGQEEHMLDQIWSRYCTNCRYHTLRYELEEQFQRQSWADPVLFNLCQSHDIVLIFVGRNTSNHACQIFCSKSNCETIYHWFFLLEITMVKIMNNLNATWVGNLKYMYLIMGEFTNYFLLSFSNSLKEKKLHFLPNTNTCSLFS
jgi:hypothetical protein